MSTATRNRAVNRHRVPIGVGLCAVLMAALAIGWNHPCEGANYTPKSPEVKQMIAKGLQFLTKTDRARVGASCLVALPFVKSGQNIENPKVAMAVSDCKSVCQKEPSLIAEDIYSTGLAVIFLCELDAQKYRSEITTLMKSLEHRQKPGGGWGYPPGTNHGTTGDTSMTQYGVLATWIVQKKAKLPTSRESTESVCNWLLRTQDPSGAWGYQGNDPGIGNNTRLPQSEVRLSLATAALGSVYICADLLKMNDAGSRTQRELPAVFKLVEDRRRRGSPSKAVDTRYLRRAQTEGNRWFEKNYVIDAPRWTHYYMYALERYQTFRDMAENNNDESPRWYNDGVRYLKESQHADGSWQSNGGSMVDTSFALLFLMRSTKGTVDEVAQSYGDGTLRGGKGLLGDTSEVRVHRGKIVGKPQIESAEQLMAVLENPDHPDFEFLIEGQAALVLGKDPKDRAEQTARLRRLVSAESYEVRMVAVTALSRIRDLDNVPRLIYALSDPDSRVVVAARDGLRFTSRKFDGFGLSDNPDPGEAAAITDEWKQWYLSIRPNARFEP